MVFNIQILDLESPSLNKENHFELKMAEQEQEDQVNIPNWTETFKQRGPIDDGPRDSSHGKL